MKSARFRLTLLMLLTTVAMILGLSRTMALAQGMDEVISAPQALTTSQAEAAKAYWTEDKMQNAVPMPLPEISGSISAQSEIQETYSPGPVVIAPSSAHKTSIQSLSEEEISEAAEDLEPLTGTYPFSYTRTRLIPDTMPTHKAFPFRTVGKLFFTIPGQGNFVCSGASVNSTNNSVIWTAGHCVYSPGVGFHTNFLFAPARRAGVNPYGTWTAKTVFTLAGWQSGLFEYDHGAIVANLGGNSSPPKKIGAAVGVLGFIANASRLQHWTLHGYPAAASPGPGAPPGTFTGEHHELCAATFATTDLPTGGGSDPATNGVGCDQTGGTSGGPWIIDLNRLGGGTNLLNGNNSYRYTGPNPPENLKLFSPYFTTGAVNLRNSAQAVPVP